MYVSKNQKDWDRHIPTILFAYRAAPSDTTGESPFYLLYGREPRLPMDVQLLPPVDLSSSILEHRKRIVQNIEMAQRLARENIQRAQQRMKAQYDKSARDPVFDIGDKVWVFTPKPRRGLSRKLQHNWHGPYRIVERFSPVHFRLRTCHMNRPVETTVHANRMKPFVAPEDRPLAPPQYDDPHEPYLMDQDLPPDSFATHSDTNPPQTTHPAATDGDRPAVDPITPPSDNPPAPENPHTPASSTEQSDIYNAERLLKRRVRNGRTEYLVKWANYPVRDSTWEPEENLLDPRLLDNFNNGPHSPPQES